METLTNPKELVANPSYYEERKNCLAGLSDDMIDVPIRELVRNVNSLPQCFTLQGCYGHFVYEGQDDPHNLDSLPRTNVTGRVEWRIAYIVFCIENSDPGRKLVQGLERIPELSPESIQFCSAQWFWDRQVNSYALQVEPDRFKHLDAAMLDYKEALHIENVRNRFFKRLHKLIYALQGGGNPGG